MWDRSESSTVQWQVARLTWHSLQDTWRQTSLVEEVINTINIIDGNNEFLSCDVSFVSCDISLMSCDVSFVSCDIGLMSCEI